MVIPGFTLVIVDDEPSIRTGLSQVFTHLGYSVRTAGDGFAALALIHECSPAILLSDLNMPGMSGFELLSVVRRLHPDIHVVATSGEFSGKSVPTGIAADAFYEKATSLSFLLELVKIEHASDRILRRSASGVTPIWLSPTAEFASREVCVLISCPRCLRAFPKVIADRTELICETRCLYCPTPIVYAIAPSPNPASEAHYDHSCDQWATKVCCPRG